MTDVGHTPGAAVRPYIALLTAFVQGRLSPHEFETIFFPLFKGDDLRNGEHVFPVLDRLFAEVDDYTGDDEVRAGVGGLNEQELRTAAEQALAELRAADAAQSESSE